MSEGAPSSASRRPWYDGLQAIFGIVHATHVRHALKDGINILAARAATLVRGPRAPFALRSCIDGRVIRVGPESSRLK